VTSKRKLKMHKKEISRASRVNIVAIEDKSIYEEVYKAEASKVQSTFEEIGNLLMGDAGAL
jgi:hypothetical protein